MSPYLIAFVAILAIVVVVVVVFRANLNSAFESRDYRAKITIDTFPGKDSGEPESIGHDQKDSEGK